MSGRIVVTFADEFTDEALDLLADALLEQLELERASRATPDPGAEEPAR